MSGTARKGSASAAPHRSTSSEHHTNMSNARTSSPSASANGLGRTPSTRQSSGPVSARAAARRPGGSRSNLSMSSVPRTFNAAPDDDSRENAALIEDLKEQVQKAETVSEQYRKQLGVLQMRLDEEVSEHAKLEEQVHEKDDMINSVRGEVRELTRQIRDLEQAREADRATMTQEKEQQAAREEELQATVQRLKETIAQKDIRMNVDGDRNLSRSPSFRNRASADLENGQFAPSSQLQRSPSRNNSKLILQKDKLIESLRLELAEAQIKLVEMENKGGGRQQELEKELLEARMSNARLMEDNESYQLLLSEKTLNGDFSKADFMQEDAPSSRDHNNTQPGAGTTATTNGLGSLADELESVGVSEGGDTEAARKLDNEIKSLKDQNKALTLYIERIIGRLLQTEGFEHILDKNDAEPSSTGASKPANTNKDLPPPPPEKEKAEPQQQTLLQRAKSVMSGQANRPRPRPRPMSQITESTVSNIHHEPPTAHENPDTAPSIPLGRSRTMHRRTRSDQHTDATAAALVGQMYRPPPSGPASPGISPSISPHPPFFSGGPNFTPSHRRASSRVTSMSSKATDQQTPLSGTDSTSDRSGEVASTEGTSSPPRPGSGMNNYTGAVMTQNKLRPLRLVQENKEMESGDQGGSGSGRQSGEEDAGEAAARKKANRGSWMPWFNRPKELDNIETAGSTTTTTSPPRDG